MFKPRDKQTSFFDATYFCEKLIPADSFYRKFREMQMNILRLFLWFSFATASLLTFLIRYSPLFYPVYAIFRFKSLPALGISCVILAAIILKYEGLRLRPVLGVVFGLVIGQLWFIEGLILILGWKFRGFAP
ncbi:MAG: hypothetical protein ACYDG4_17080 [Desulfuromonadaceae bacterium]